MAVRKYRERNSAVLKRRTISLKEAVDKKLQQIAEKRGVSFSWLVERILAKASVSLAS